MKIWLIELKPQPIDVPSTWIMKNSYGCWSPTRDPALAIPFDDEATCQAFIDAQSLGDYQPQLVDVPGPI